MAVYLDDDFQGYSVGTNLPFGSFIGSGAIVQIVSEPGGTGVAGTDRSFLVFQGLAEYVHGSYLASFTQFLAVRLTDSQSSNPQPFWAAANGPNGLAQTFTLIQLRVEPDGSVTAVCPVSNQILGNSGDFYFDLYTWNFFQINCTLSDVTILGVKFVNIEFEVWLNGISIISFNTTTTAGVTQLANGTSEVNRFDLTGGFYGAFTLQSLTAGPDYPHPGSPAAKVHQAVVEVDALFDSGKLQAIQAVTEVDVLPDSAAIVVFQMVVEVDVLVANRWYISES